MTLPECSTLDTWPVGLFLLTLFYVDGKTSQNSWARQGRMRQSKVFLSLQADQSLTVSFREKEGSQEDYWAGLQVQAIVLMRKQAR